MRPFFSYYGAKWTGAKHYGPPRQDLVVEPFAGSAAYSTRWNAQHVKLYDVSADICDLWDFLIHSSEQDIISIPDQFEHIDEVMNLPRGPQLLCRFWIAKGRAEPSNQLSPWYMEWKHATDCRVWSASVKQRIIRQKPNISEWTVDQQSWETIPVTRAHWHVDPPYNNNAGSKYPNGNIDYAALGDWCRTLPGDVDVCENVGSDWLPFEPLYNVVTSRGRKSGAVSKESVWSRFSMLEGPLV